MKTKKELIQEKEYILGEIISLGMDISDDEFVSESEELLVKRQIIDMNNYMNTLIIRIEMMQQKENLILPRQMTN